MKSRPTLQYVLLAIVFCITMVFFSHHLWYMADLLRGNTDAITPPFTVGWASNTISTPEPEAEAAGIRPGDSLLAINGRPYRGFADYIRSRQYAHPGDALAVTVRHQDANSGRREETVRITLANRESASTWIGLPIALGLVLPFFCLLLGFGVAALRPREPVAWLLLGLMLGPYNFITVGSEYFNATPFAYWGLLFEQFASQTWYLWIFLLGIYFPGRLELDRRFPWLKWLLIAPLVLRAGIQIVVVEGLLTNYRFPERIPRFLAKFSNATGPLSLAAIVLFFALLAVKYFTAQTQDARRRLRLLTLGTFFSIVPLLALIVASEAQKKPIDNFSPWLELPALLLILLLPITLAYLIIVHKALDVRVVLRQGLQYGLARGGVWLLQLALTALLAIAIAYYVSRHPLGQPQIFGILALAIFLTVRLRDLMARFARWTDRRFFREAYNTELLLAELSDNVRNIVETRPLLETVTSRIAQALHVPRIAVLLPAGGPFQPAYSLGYAGADLKLAFPEGGATQHLRQSKAAARVYLDDPNNWVNSEAAVSGEERERLAQLNSELLLPLIVKDRMLGFISLSQKRSEQAYSGTDLHLLNSVASQTALALENSRLSGEIAQEVAHRESLAREMEIAREVQEHLLPQALPAISGVDIAGSFRPAQGVGGDYYDFLELAGGKLGIAIGDVSGKGVSAALVMANLQASLRSQSLTAADGGDHLAGILTRINRLIYQSSASSRYATFFFAVYDPPSRVLSYVNAGHNAPMLFRGPRTVERLEAGGPVIGLLPHCEYVQRTLTLKPGDLLLAFTDGISETMNSADEEWGEEALVETVQRHESLCGKELLAEIMRSADEFAQGAKQHDDMTMLAVRVL